MDALSERHCKFLNTDRSNLSYEDSAVEEISFLLAELSVKLRRIVFSSTTLHYGSAMLSQYRVAMRSFCLFFMLSAEGNALYWQCYQ